MALTLCIPFVAALLIPVFHASPNAREAVTLTAATLLFVTVLGLVPAVSAGGRPEALQFQIVEGVSFALKLEPLGMMFMLVASGLWIINSIYSIGYMRGHDEPRQTSFYVCFAVAISSTMGLALSANLFTLFIFYEILTLSTYPLVVHKGNEEARNGGRVYLLILLG
ncbi:MAG: monovalent cation/H+ antiporter subunit D family protein, partial [Alphaproteobacteria bacterium]|nr:monovalent cation/H+ antiporter subunit D family protein [Alphaproteobacteria bacterium]